MVVFWALVIWAFMTLVGRTPRAGPLSAQHEDDPEQILARRFAAGDIDTEEYRQRLDTLRRADLSHVAQGRRPS